MAENSGKRPCMRDPPSCWIPSCAVATSTASASRLLIDPPTDWIPKPCNTACGVKMPSVSTALPPLLPPVTLVLSAPPMQETSLLSLAPTCERMRRLEEARLRSLRYRDPRFPGAGLLREDGGVYALTAKAILDGHTSLP
jgi:hypothetical protein